MDSQIYEQLTKIGRSLFAEKDIHRLCTNIIQQAQEITHAEGATLYLVDLKRPTHLKFSIIHNDKLGITEALLDQKDSPLQPIPLYESNGSPNLHHVAAYAANRRQMTNVADTYGAQNFDFSGAHEFDQKMGYHTQSVLAVPLTNEMNELVGVLQLINARDENVGKVIPFPDDCEPVVATLAAFAAIAINSQNMSRTQNQLLVELAAQANTQALMQRILCEAQALCHADGGSLYLMHDEDDQTPELRFAIVRNDSLQLNYGGIDGQPIPFAPIPLVEDNGEPNFHNVVTYCAHTKETVVIDDAYAVEKFDFSGTRRFDEEASYRSRSFLTVPLLNHNKDVIGVLQLVNARDPITHDSIAFSPQRIPLVRALATYAAITLNNQMLVQELKTLLDTFIQCIAKAIDAKSPHTSGHCQRVPLLTELIAEAACQDQSTFKNFNLDDDGWYELRVAAWLHDCGKLATPDSVLDKSTKLHGLLDGIDTVNSRFTALKYQRQSDTWQTIAAHPEKADELQQQLRLELDELEQSRQFIERCNKGGEFMSEEDKTRVAHIAQQPWINHKGETQRLLDDDEVYNLCIERGTLTPEERQIINNHIVVTIDMLESLEFPKKLRRVPEYAGGHHEKMDGSGFPKGLTRDQMSLPARMMAIADIFEALTAKDRPYKDPMKISQALTIMQRMRNDNHIDPDLFALFVSANVWQTYARKVLSPEQLDIDDAVQFL